MGSLLQTSVLVGFLLLLPALVYCDRYVKLDLFADANCTQVPTGNFTITSVSYNSTDNTPNTTFVAGTDNYNQTFESAILTNLTGEVVSLVACQIGLECNATGAIQISFNLTDIGGTQREREQVPIQGWSDGEWYHPPESSNSNSDFLQQPRTMVGSVGEHGVSFSVDPAARGWLEWSSVSKTTPVQAVEGVLELKNVWDWNSIMETATYPSGQMQAELSRRTTRADDDPLRFLTIRIDADIVPSEYTSKVTYLPSVVEQKNVNYDAHLRRPSTIDAAELAKFQADCDDDTYPGYH